MFIEKIKNHKILFSCLTATLVYLIFIYLLTFEYEEPKFTLDTTNVNKDELIINIEMMGNDDRTSQTNKIKSLIYKGETFEVEPKYSDRYCIYASHQEKYKKLCFDNIFYSFRGDKNRINHIIVNKNNNEIHIEYYGLKEDITNKHSSSAKRELMTHLPNNKEKSAFLDFYP